MGNSDETSPFFFMNGSKYPYMETPPFPTDAKKKGQALLLHSFQRPKSRWTNPLATASKTLGMDVASFSQDSRSSRRTNTGIRGWTKPTKASAGRVRMTNRSSPPKRLHRPAM